MAAGNASCGIIAGRDGLSAASTVCRTGAAITDGAPNGVSRAAVTGNAGVGAGWSADSGACRTGVAAKDGADKGTSSGVVTGAAGEATGCGAGVDSCPGTGTDIGATALNWGGEADRPVPGTARCTIAGGGTLGCSATPNAACS